MMRKVFLIIVAFALILPSAAFAEKLGEITSYTGEVLIRSKGEWSKITNVPQPVFSSDKVVTKRGRAEIRFVDGGFIRMHLDSILSIIRIKETTVLTTKKPVTSRTVKVLVGEIWFDVNVKKGHSFKFRTPSMTAAIRGTSGPVKHTLDGQSSIGFRTGRGDISGKYKTVPVSEMRPFASRYVYEPVENLPQSDPDVINSNMMSLADTAHIEHVKARLAMARAEEKSKVTRTARLQAASKRTARSRIIAAKASAKAEATKTRAQLQIIKAKIATAEDALFEARIFGDTKAEEAAERSIKISRQILGKVENILNVVQELEKASTEANTVLGARSIAALVQAESSAALGNAAVVKVMTQLAIAETAGDEAAVQTSERHLSTTEQATLAIEKQVNKTIWLVGQMEGETEKQTEIQLIAAEAIADVSSANAANADAQANVAVEATAGDTESLKAAKSRAKELLQLTITVNLVVADLEKALAEGDLEALMDAAIAIYLATKDITGKVEPPYLLEPPAMKPRDEPLLPRPHPRPPSESEDLPTSPTMPTGPIFIPASPVL
jgi:hypothetical protein